MNRDWNDVSEKMAEFHEQRLWRQRKDAELPDFLLLDPFLHLAGEKPPQIVLLDRPVYLFMIGIDGYVLDRRRQNSRTLIA